MSGSLALSVLFTVFSPPVGPVFRLLLGMGGGNSEAETFKSTACNAAVMFSHKNLISYFISLF